LVHWITRYQSFWEDSGESASSSFIFLHSVVLLIPNNFAAFVLESSRREGADEPDTAFFAFFGMEKIIFKLSEELI